MAVPIALIAAAIPVAGQLLSNIGSNQNNAQITQMLLKQQEQQRKEDAERRIRNTIAIALVLGFLIVLAVIIGVVKYTRSKK